MAAWILLWTYLICASVFSSAALSLYETRFLELLRPRLAVLERRDRMGVAVGGDVSLGQPCWSKISMQPLLPIFVAILMAVWPWLSFAFTSIPYCGQKIFIFVFYISLTIGAMRASTGCSLLFKQNPKLHVERAMKCVCPLFIHLRGFVCRVVL